MVSSSHQLFLTMTWLLQLSVQVVQVGLLRVLSSFIQQVATVTNDFTERNTHVDKIKQANLTLVFEVAVGWRQYDIVVL